MSLPENVIHVLKKHVSSKFRLRSSSLVARCNKEERFRGSKTEHVFFASKGVLKAAWFHGTYDK